MAGLIAAAGGQCKGLMLAADTVAQFTVVEEVLGYQVHDAAGMLDRAATGHHLGAKNGAAQLIEERWPDDEVGNIQARLRRLIRPEGDDAD